PGRRLAGFVSNGEPPLARIAGTQDAIQRDDRHEQRPGPYGVGEERGHTDACHQVSEDRGAADEQQQLQLAAHAPSGIATVVLLRAATCACSTTLGTRRLS